jgi:hypothetical protein
MHHLTNTKIVFVFKIAFTSPRPCAHHVQYILHYRFSLACCFRHIPWAISCLSMSDNVLCNLPFIYTVLTSVPWMSSTDDLKNSQNCKFWLKKLTGLTNSSQVLWPEKVKPLHVFMIKNQAISFIYSYTSFNALDMFHQHSAKQFSPQ